MIRLTIFVVLLVILAGCTQPNPAAENVSENISNDMSENESALVGGDKDEHGCIGSAGYTWCEGKQRCLRPWEEPCEAKLNLSEAIDIAQKSDCIKEGSLTTETMYNNVSGTWWIDMNLSEPKPGCSPACVVYEQNGTAEINWRCTGLIK
jgi:hypothetical protein